MFLNLILFVEEILFLNIYFLLSFFIYFFFDYPTKKKKKGKGKGKGKSYRLYPFRSPFSRFISRFSHRV
jgi:hypothetical protein